MALSWWCVNVHKKVEGKALLGHDFCLLLTVQAAHFFFDLAALSHGQTEQNQEKKGTKNLPPLRRAHSFSFSFPLFLLLRFTLLLHLQGTAKTRQNYMTELFIPVPTGKAAAPGQMPPPKRRKPDKAPATPIRSSSGESLSVRNNGFTSTAPVYHKQTRKGRTSRLRTAKKNKALNGYSQTVESGKTPFSVFFFTLRYRSRTDTLFVKNKDETNAQRSTFPFPQQRLSRTKSISTSWSGSRTWDAQGPN